MEAFPKGQEAGTVTSGRKPVLVFLLSCSLSLAVRFRFWGRQRMLPGSLSLESPSQCPRKGRWGRGKNVSVHMHSSGKNPGRSHSC